MSNQTNPFDGKINRRDFLKIGAASGVALILSGILKEKAHAATTYFGLDSNSVICCDMDPLNFYIGRGGDATYVDPYAIAFNTNSATTAGKSYTHIFWWLHGPADAASYGFTDYYAFGKAQAKAAADAWYSSFWAPYAYGKTFFADIEYTDSAPYGWYTRDQYGNKVFNKTNNRLVLNGWLAGIATYLRFGTNPGFVPGFYTRPNIFKPVFGTTGYKTSRGAVLWISGCHTNDASVICSPCSASCITTKQDVTNYFPTIAQVTLGGNKAVIWQYWIDCVGNCGCSTKGDWDASQQSGYSKFNAVINGTTNYYDGPCPA